MSVSYQAILWNRQKKIYDTIFILFILILSIAFCTTQLIWYPEITIETLIIRLTAINAITLLQLILIIGPLCRLNPKFLPLLYNRRHLGVSMFFFSLLHGVMSMIQFHALGDSNMIISVFTSNQNYRHISQFPFQTLGFFALCIFFLMAVSSHDFWLKTFGPKLWKSLHMMVYVAYVLVLLHVLLGALQYETHPYYFVVILTGAAIIFSLHLWTGYKTWKHVKVQKQMLKKEGFYCVATVDDISEKRANIYFIDRQNIAVFKYDGKIAAVNNVCRHQMGPLGEGKIVDGCITCPWHGYQYKPEDGCAPPPFTEKLETYTVKLVGKKIWVNPVPHPEGTFLEPQKIH